jgi:hypothetical protein
MPGKQWLAERERERERERGEMEKLTYYHVKCHAGEATS